jgi:DNA-directed RNA polymerase subunit M
MFCPKCGLLLKPKNGKMYGSCGYKQQETVNIKMEHEPDSFKEPEILESDGSESLPITEEECPKCHNEKAYFGTRQTGPSDEPEIMIFRCVKCKHTWRSTNNMY